MQKFIYSFYVLLFSTSITLAQTFSAFTPKSDVFMQGFYWNSPPGGIWYDSLSKLAPRLASAGFSAIWFPSPSKGAGGGFSMGYDPYDHYDFGEFFQKGSKETRFGSRKELEHAISTFHSVGIQVFADAVLRHMMGGEERAPYQCIPQNNGNPIVADSAYLIFHYPNGSGRFPKDASTFYPNAEHCFVDSRFVATDPIFRFGEWLDHYKQSVVDSLIVWGKYLRNELHFDGFRLDAVKSIDPAFMATWLKGTNGNGYAVAELWSNTSDIGSWLNVVKNQNGANVAMFDFPLRYTLKDMCNNTGGSFDMRNLDNAGLAGAGISGFDYSTFVENHDFDRIGYDGQTDSGHDPVLSDKQLAYAYILFSEGRPCVFFKDYFTYGYAGAIDTLMWIRQKFIYGGTTKRSGLYPYYLGGSGSQDELAQDIFVARRDGGDGKPPVYIVINDNAQEWRGVWVNTNYPNQKFKDYTHHDVTNNIRTAQADGRIELWAPPRSYVLYIPDTTQNVNHSPILNKIPDLLTYTNALFTFHANANDADKEKLTYSLSGNPAWLAVDSTGKLFGVPAFSDTGKSTVIFSVHDAAQTSDVDTFSLEVQWNVAPILSSLSDTTATATKRFERQVFSTDGDNDSLEFSLQTNPKWLHIGTSNGLLSGTPAVEDTGASFVTILVTDTKGGYDTTKFQLHVSEIKDSIIATYGKPTIDGTIQINNTDWKTDWRVTTDPDSDSFWWNKTTGPINNELYGLYVTWDSDSLYLGIDYYLNDKNNTLILYVDALKDSGQTNFKSTSGYLGDYPKNNRFRAEDGIDFFIAAYNQDSPSVFMISGNQSINITKQTSHVRGSASRGAELSLSFNDIYGLGAGLIPKNTTMKFVALLSGGYDYGSGDAMPDNPDVNGDTGPDSLVHLTSVTLDKDGNGIPDPTIFISTEVVKKNIFLLPSEFVLEQNFPNPFNPTTTINFQLPKTSYITLKVYDAIGRTVATLFEGTKSAGRYSVQLNASQLSSGIYFYQLKSENFTDTKKLLLIK